MTHRRLSPGSHRAAHRAARRGETPSRRAGRSLRRSSVGVLALALTGGTLTIIGSAPDATATTTVLAADDFGTPTPSGWGRADTGGAWSTTSTRGISVANGSGVIDLGRAGEDRTLSLSSVSASDLGVETTSTMPVRPTTGSGVRYALRVRKSGNRSYDAVVRVVPGGQTLLSLSRVDDAGRRTRLTDDVALPARTGPSTRLRLSVDVTGASAVDLDAKAELVESVTTATTTSAPASTTGTARAVAVARKRVAATKAALRATRGTKARAKARKRLVRARAALRAAERAHVSMRSRRVSGTASVTRDVVTASRTVSTVDSSADRISGPGHLALWAYSSADAAAGAARITVAQLMAKGRAATPAPAPAPPAAQPNRAPTASFTPTTSRKSLTATVDGSASSDADGTVTSHAWTFGDGARATGARASHTYALPGTYTVTLVVSDDDGATATTTRSVTVTGPNQAPSPAITATQQDLEVVLDASGSKDADGEVRSAAWDLGDGRKAGGTRVTHRYDRPGTYTVALTVTDDDGAAATTTRQVEVTAPPVPNRAPVAAFTASTPAKGLTVALDGTASSDEDGAVASYDWAFGDGTTGTGRTTSHAFPRAGSYVVELTVSDDDGATSTTSRTVVVRAANQAPVAVFDATSKDLAASLDASGSRDADGRVASYSWAFGDGATGTGPTVTRTYPAAGTYTVRLTVTDDDGATATATRAVTVTNPPPPPAKGKPSAYTTGVPSGTTLTRHDGDMVITKAGTRIDAMDIHGFVTIKAPNVTITRSRVHGGRATGNIGLVTNYGYDGLVVEDTDLQPEFPSVWIDGLKGWDFTARRIHVVGGVDSVKIHGDNATIEDSLLENTQYYASDPNQGGGATHNDNVQVLNGRDVNIVGNTIRGATNMAIYAAPEKGVATVRAVGNWVDGGHCTMKYSDKGGYGIVATVTGNRFGPNRKVKSCVLLATPASDLRASENTWESDGTAVPILRKAD